MPDKVTYAKYTTVAPGSDQEKTLIRNGWVLHRQWTIHRHDDGSVDRSKTARSFFAGLAVR